MAEARPFRALRYNAALVDPAVAIAPPYDVISPALQRSLYERSPNNIVRIEYGEQRDDDRAGDNRYTRAAADLRAWQEQHVLVQDDAPAIYHYRQPAGVLVGGAALRARGTLRGGAARAVGRRRDQAARAHAG
jgi:uncharacterized protein (DUF1015 family)